MKNISEVTGLSYEAEECVFFGNAKQAACYKEWGAKLLDVFVDGQLRWVFVFSRQDHERLKMRWKYQGDEFNERRQEI